MRFADYSGLDPELSKIVNSLFYNYFKEGTIEDADVLLCGIGNLKISPKNKVKYLVCNCTNTNHIEINNGARLISLEGESEFLDTITSTAEHTIHLMFQLLRGHVEYHDWCRPDKPCRTLRGKNVGIIGHGRIGKQVSKLLTAFGAKPIWYDLRTPEIDTLGHIIKHSDIITLHTTVHKNQLPILGIDELCRVKDGAYIINTSRGEAIDEEALIKNLSRLGGFAADVLCGDPTPRNRNSLLSFGNVVLTPHIGGYSLEDLQRTSEFCFRKLMGEMYDNEKR